MTVSTSTFRKLGVLAIVTPLVLLSGCRSDAIEPQYRFSAGSILEYRLAATGDARWDLAGGGRGGYEVVFHVTEEVLEASDDGALVEVSMVPRVIEERGLPSPGEGERSFTLKIANSGEVVEVLEVDGIPATALEPDQLAFIGTYRPALPREPVRIGETWSTAQEVAIGRVLQEVRTEGELTSLRMREGQARALVAYRGRGTAEWTTSLPQGESRLDGIVGTSIDADFAMEDGALDRARSTTTGIFEIEVATGSGRLPLTGTLHLTLELDLERLN